MQREEFTIRVGRLGGRSERFRFNQRQVLVGRGRESDLRIEHSSVARRQLLIERDPGGDPERFRIAPYVTVNPTHVNGRLAEEGALDPGDVLAIAELRLVIEPAWRSLLAHPILAMRHLRAPNGQA